MIKKGEHSLEESHEKRQRKKVKYRQSRKVGDMPVREEHETSRLCEIL